MGNEKELIDRLAYLFIESKSKQACPDVPRESITLARDLLIAKVLDQEGKYTVIKSRDMGRVHQFPLETMKFTSTDMAQQYADSLNSHSQTRQYIVHEKYTQKSESIKTSESGLLF